MDFKIGDKVNCTSVKTYSGLLAIVIDTHENEGYPDRCLIEYQDIFTVSGGRMQSWLSCKDLQYDIQHLREEKLNSLLEK
jgi:hypothetical protein